jgi:uncharacterized membrane protein
MPDKNRDGKARQDSGPIRNGDPGPNAARCPESAGRTSAPDLDEATEAVIGTLLRVGVMLAAAIVAIGGALYLLKYGGEHRSLGEFRGEPHAMHGVAGIAKSAISFGRRGIIQLGLLVLIATPIARVAFAVYTFARQRDYLYVGVTLVVLAVLCFSLLGARP